MRSAKTWKPAPAGMVLAMALTVAGWTWPAMGSFHTFQVDELYSSPDGIVQFIELHEAFGADDQQFLTGRALKSSQGAATRTYAFPSDLPNRLTAGKRVLIATPAFAGLGIVTPDYVVPAPFLFPDGGTIDYAGVDTVVYPALPADGVSSLGRSGAVDTNSPTNYAGQTGSIGAVGPPPLALPIGVATLDRSMLAALSALLVVGAILMRRFR